MGQLGQAMTWIKYPKEEALVLDNGDDDMFDFVVWM